MTSRVEFCQYNGFAMAFSLYLQGDDMFVPRRRRGTNILNQKCDNPFLFRYDRVALFGHWHRIEDKLSSRKIACFVTGDILELQQI